MRANDTGRKLCVRVIAPLLLLCLSCAKDSSLQFAWLSDTHIGSPGAAAALRAAVRDINSMKAHFAIVSGDVTETGKTADFILARRILDSLTVPYHIIPGNHDCKWSESAGTRFAELWGSDTFYFSHHGFTFIGLHQGPIMRMGKGHFAPEDLRWLDSILQGVSADEPLIIVTHYPVDPSISNWYELIDRAKRYDTKVILVGHGHRNSTLDFEGIPGVMGRSNLGREDSPAGYTLVEVEGDSIYFSERLTGAETRPVWHRLSLERRNYHADTTQYPRPDFSANEEFPGVSVRWSYDTHYTITSAPALGENRVIVGNSSGTVYGLSSHDGSLHWSFAAGGGVYSTAACAQGRVVFGSADSSVYCLDEADGALLWRVKTGNAVVAAPVIDDSLVLIGGGDQMFRALDLASGIAFWEFSGVEGFVETRPLVYENMVIFGAWDSHLYSLHIADGSLAWKWSGGRPGTLYSPAACWAVGSDGRVFIVAPDRYMTAIDVKDGTNVWRSNRYQVRESIGLSEGGRTVYARCMTDTLLAVDATASKLRPTWAKHCGYGYDIDPSMPRELDGMVYFGTGDGFIYALSAQDGALRWRYRTGVALINTVAPVDVRRVVVTDFDGRVTMVAVDDSR